MLKCGKFGAASTAGWGAGAAIFSPVPGVGKVVLLQGAPLKPPQLNLLILAFIIIIPLTGFAESMLIRSVKLRGAAQ